MSSNDNKQIEKPRLRLADASSVPSPPPSGSLTGKSNDKGFLKTVQGDLPYGSTAPGAFSVGASSSSAVDADRISDSKDNKLRLAPATSTSASANDARSISDKLRLAPAIPAAGDGTGSLANEKRGAKRSSNQGKVGDLTALAAERRARRSEQKQNRTKIDKKEKAGLVEAKMAEDVDVEALVNERIQQMVVGVAAAEEDDGNDDDDSDQVSESGKSRKFYLVAFVGLVVVVGAIVGVFAGLPSEPSIPTTPSPTVAPTTSSPTAAPTTIRLGKLQAVLADHDLNREAFRWIVEEDTWEPENQDDDSDYLWLERYVMTELYFTTSGPSWWINDRWLSNETVCNWYMESVNACPGPILDLDLAGNLLTTTIPTILGSLTKLTRLNLDNNRMKSNIPSTLGNLINLQHLSISRNQQLSSSIPSTIGRLTKLTYLSLYDNELTSSIPQSIQNLTELRVLELYNNQLSGSIPVLPILGVNGTCELHNNCFSNVSHGELQGCNVTFNCV